MKHGMFVLLLGVSLASGVFADDEMKLGKEITLDSSTKIATLLANPGDYVGQKVRVEGKVVAVCEKMGCWMEIVGENPSEKIKAKVEDGVIIFPKEAIGRPAVVEGEMQKFDLTLEETCEYLRHEAEERGESFDENTVKEPKTFYQIKAYGAVVK